MRALMPLPQFDYVHVKYFQIPSHTSAAQAQFFMFVQKIVSEITGFNFTYKNIRRSWNNGERYGELCGDNFGVYHYLTGYLPLRHGNVFAIDDFLILRPREWGLTWPDPTGDLKNALEHQIGYQAVATIVTHTGTNDWQTRYRYQVIRSGRSSFCVTLLNAVIQAHMRYYIPQLNLQYYSCNAANNPGYYNWVIRAQGVPPMSILQGLRIIDPTTVINYIWREGLYLAPSVVTNVAGTHMLATVAYADRCIFKGAGVNLRRVVCPAHPQTDDWPNADLLPWEVVSAEEATALADYAFTRPSGYQTLPAIGAKPTDGTTIAAANIDVAAIGDVVVQVQTAAGPPSLMDHDLSTPAKNATPATPAPTAPAANPNKKQKSNHPPAAPKPPTVPAPPQVIPVQVVAPEGPAAPAEVAIPAPVNPACKIN